MSCAHTNPNCQIGLIIGKIERHLVFFVVNYGIIIK